MVQTTSTIYQSGVASSGSLNLDNAAAAGDEIVYVVNDMKDTFEVRNGAILSIGTGAGSGTAAFVQSCGSVYSTPNPVDSSFPDKVRIMGMTISAGAQVHVGKNDTLFVSATSNAMKNCSAPIGARGDISIAYNGGSSAGAAASSASLFLDDGAVLSGGGYLGGVADKGAAQTWISNQTQSSGALQASRTGAISAGNKVKVNVDGDWAVIGDTSTVGADTVFGNDDEITIGGNIGVFMNTVLRIGDRVHISQTGQNGSGIFVGSGAKMLVGNNASIYARGGFGAGYAGEYSAAIVSIGSGASITLDHQADGILAAEASAVVTIGDGATINAAMISVGYAQDPNNGSFISAKGAPSMQIGNNATINLMTEALFDDPTEFQIAQKGYIVLDSFNSVVKPAMMSVGSNVNLVASGISVGDLIKQYVIPNDPSRFGSYAGRTFLWGAAAQANKLSFDAGASIDLNGGGIEVNGTNDGIIFSGGTINVIGSDGLTSTISNTISAGWISMGSSFKVLTDSNGVSTLVTSKNGGNNSITFGDDFNINLQSNAATGATGNLTADGSQDVYSFGNNLHLNANSIYLGQFSHTYSGVDYTATPTGVSITFGDNANVMLSGGFIMNSATGMFMSMGNSGNLSIASGFLFNNIGTASGVVRIGNNANIMVNSGFDFSNGAMSGTELIGNNASIAIGNGFNFINGGSAGTLSIGNDLDLSTGNGFSFLNSGASGYMLVGSNAQMNIDGGFSFSNGGLRAGLSIGNNGHINVGSGFDFNNVGARAGLSIGNDLILSTGSGFSFSNKTYLGSMTVGSNAHMNINGDFNFNNGTYNGSLTIGDNASVAISNGFNFSNGTSSGNLSIGNNGHIDVGSGFNFSNGGSAGNLNIGDSTELNVKNDFAFTNAVASGAIAIGSGANLNIGGNFSVYNGDLGKVSFGDVATVKVGSSLSIYNNGDNGIINVGSNDNISVAGSFDFVNSGAAGSINIGASTTIIADNGFGFVNSGVSGAFLAQDNISIKAGGSGFTFVNSGSTGASMTVGNNANFDINGNFQYLNPGSDNSSNAPLSVGSSGVFNITSNFIVVGSSAAAIFGAYTSMVVGGNVSMLEDYNSIVASAGYQYGSYTDLSIGSNMSICGSNIHFNADISNTISVGGNIFLMGTAGVWSKGDGGTLNTSGIFVLGGPDSNGNSIVNESFVVGASNVVTISTGGLLVDVANGQYVQGDNGILDTLGDITIKGAGTIFSAGNDFVISTHGNGITLDSGAKSFTIGDNAILDADGGIISMGAVSTVGASANNIIIGSNASVNIGGILYGNATQRVVIADQAHGNLGNITMSGRADKLTIGNDANLSMGNVALNSSANQLLVGSGATLNMGALSVLSNGTVNIGDNASVSILGSTNLAGGEAELIISNNANIIADNINIDGANASIAIGNNANINTKDIHISGTSARLIVGSNASANMGNLDIISNAAYATFGDNAVISMADLNMQGTGAYTTIGNGATLDTGNITLNGDTEKLVIGSNASINTGDITFNGANQVVSIGNGANASFGNIALLGSGAALNRQSNSLIVGSGNYFASNMTMGVGLRNSITLASGAYWSVNNLIFSGVANNSATSLTPNITLQSGATLIVDNMTGIGLSPTNKVFIRASAGGNVIIHSGFFDTVSNATSANALDVNFTGATTNPVIFEYDGDIKDTEGKLTLRGLPAMTDNTKLIFNLGKDTKYTDQNRFKTVYEKGTAGNNIMIVQYMSVETGEWEEVARFSVPQWGGPTATNPANILVVKQADGSYKMTITKCFLSGTHIMTENGERVVEELAVGDQIITFKDGKEVLQTIVWVGSMDVDVNNYSNKETLYPIRIKAHAFGLNQPHRDLLVTPEHTIYVDGGLTPARMLVNGRSIIVDKSIEKYTVHHIETIEHSIILSENLLTESYLNTDNKDMFNGETVNLRLEFNENAGHKSWEEDAAAPLVVAREKVEPIWQRLDRRATQLGFATVERAKTTRDPALCLTTQKGDVIKPVDIQGKVYSFYLPANVRVIGLRSRAAQPAEAVGPFCDDRRMLGVLVSKFTVLGDETVTVLPSEMSEVSGWYPAEKGRSDRWTKGLAILPQEISEISNKVRLLKVELTDSSVYLLDEEGDWAKTA